MIPLFCRMFLCLNLPVPLGSDSGSLAGMLHGDPVPFGCAVGRHLVVDG